MNKNTAKTYIRQLVKREGSEKAVSQLLGITPRYVKMLLAGQVPSEPLRKLIKVVLK
jgi:predicted transcriptional regulator